MSTERAAISRRDTASDGLPMFGWDNAKVKCAECDGWTGTVCPHGCGVRLVSTQREDDEAFKVRQCAEEAQRRLEREERRARRKAAP